ncbi:MAG TPA: hypothetical protein VFG74_01940 [Miltoncostaeaceae bacterium]|nr:hypothetical protein [Miltoncostaeaceae bacterium]
MLMLAPGDKAIITRRTPMRAGSLAVLAPGDEVEIVKVGERHCAVRLLGSVFVVPTDALAPLASDRGETGAPSDEDDWWNF